VLLGVKRLVERSNSPFAQVEETTIGLLLWRENARNKTKRISACPL